MDTVYFPLKDYANFRFKGYTIILPLVAVGNVGQLTVDLLLTSLETKLIGRFHHSSFLPLVGADPFDPNQKELATSSQVFLCSRYNLIIVQQRSPIALSSQKTFASLLASWIKSEGFHTTILLSSCFSQFLKDRELNKKLQYMYSSNLDTILSDAVKEQGIHLISPAQDVDDITKLHLPGSGMTKMLHSSVLDAKVPVITFFVFCSEGNNIPDALNLADTLKMISPTIKDAQKGPNWIIPDSWSAMFGNSAPITMF